MKFILLVTGPAYGTQQSTSALLFAQALIKEKQNLSSVFFYLEGVLNSNRLIIPTYNELNIVKNWQLINIKYKTSLYVCISAALRRGILDKKEAESFSIYTHNLQTGFKFISLIKFAEKLLKCDRLVQF